MAKKSRKTRKLVLGYLEKVSSKMFSAYPKELTDLVGRQHGVYALYKGKRLYYVGLATNLRGRINTHLRDKHAGKWDKFSLYLVRKADHIRELESLILRISDPTGNATKGKLPGAINLKSGLKKRLRETQQRELADLLGGKKKPSREIKRKPSISKSKTVRTPVLAKYNLGHTKLRATVKGVKYEARLRKDGTINLGGRVYNSPSMAGKNALGRKVNGWTFWRFKNDKGEWVFLDELRKK